MNLIKYKSIYLYLLIIIIFTLTFNLQAQDVNWCKLKENNRKIVNNNPHNVMANFKLSIAMANIGHVHESYKLFNKLNEITTEKKFNNIISPYIKKIEVDDQNILLLNYAAFYELIKDEYQNAISYFTKIIKLEPENIWILNYMASCYIEMEEYDKAEKIIKKSQSINDSDFAHLLYGLIHYNNGNYIKSAVEFGKSGELFSILISEVK